MLLFQLHGTGEMSTELTLQAQQETSTYHNVRLNFIYNK